MTAALSWPLQVALHQRLTADPALTGLLGGRHVYDGPPHADGPDAPAPPYISFGAERTAAWIDKTAGGAAVELTFEIWSRARGARDVKRIMARLCDILLNEALPLSRGRHVLTKFVSADSDHLDGRLRRGRLRLKFLIEDS